MKKVKCCLVEDEAITRDIFREQLNLFKELEIIGTCASGAEAVDFLSRNKPDLLFLDIELRDMDAFEMLKKANIVPRPLIIFVSSFPHYAINAFDSFAIDYMLKPVSVSRLQASIMRVIGLFRVLRGEGMDKMDCGIRNGLIATPTQESARLTVHEKGEDVVLDTHDILFVDAAGDYACIHTETDVYVKRVTLKSIINELDCTRFRRVHRSAIVNFTYVNKVVKHPKGECTLYLAGDKTVSVSRTYRKEVESFMKTLL